LGGEPFVIMYEAKTGRVYGLNGSGKAPMAATREYFTSRGYNNMPLTGPLAAAIPGEVSGWEAILDRFGTRPLSKLLEPAIGYAEEGHPISAYTARGFRMMNEKLNEFPDTAAIFTNNGAPLTQNDVLIQKNLGKTLRRGAQGGAEEFYRGDTAKEIIRSTRAYGGLYTEQEFASHETTWYEPPISTTYRGYKVYETTPPSQGFLLLEMLNIMEEFDIGGMGFYNADSIHAMVQAKKLAMADRNAYMGDPEYVDNPLEELISKGWAAQRATLINKEKATNHEPGPLVGAIPGDDNTSYFCVMDKEGNALSFIHSLSMGFGSGFVAGETGIALNNRIGRGFSLVDGHPNVIEPGKKTMHTLNAYMVFKEDKLYVVGATPGGDRQIPWNAQVISNLIDHGLDPQEAVEAPRWANTPGTDPSTINDPFVLELEPGISPDEVAKLKAKGHTVDLKDPPAYGGSVKLIMVDPDTGVRMAASDSRTDGYAAVI